MVKGEVIAVLENPEFIQLQQDYLDYKSQLIYLKEELERQQELAKENVNAKKTLQKACCVNDIANDAPILIRSAFSGTSCSSDTGR